MDKESVEAKHYFSKYNHPLDLTAIAQDAFDYADYTLAPQDYHAVYITLDDNNDYVLYICSQIIELDNAEMWDFIEIAKNTANKKSTRTIVLQEMRRNLRTKDSKRSSGAVYANISTINKKIRDTLGKDIDIITKRKNGYYINIHPKKLYSIYISDEIK